ncbi:MAG: DUF935 family protein [Synergistaceae bacterium]|nr:DUF935 family protein [Synergistaceae bacterium]
MMKGKAAMKAKDASQSVGYGYSQILSELMTTLDRPITNSDEFRMHYKQMLSDDETIGTGIEYLTGRVVSRIGAYTHEDEKIKELVDRSIESIQGTMTEVRRGILRDSFAYGYGVGEFTLKNEGGKWILSSVQILDPTSIKFRMEKREDNSYGVGAVIQDAGFEEIEIPAGKCIIKTYGDSTTPYGKSLLRKCYRWWSFKKAIPKMWAVALERYGTPMLAGKSGDRETRKKLEAVFSNIYSNPHIVTDEKTEIHTVFTPNGGISGGYLTAMEICDKMMYRAMFLPSLLGSGENGGSYSLGQVHLELFNATAAALAEDYADTELECLWRPIIEWNYGTQENYGSFLINDAMPTSEKVALSGMMLNLAGAGVIDPSSDREWMREMLGLPDVEEGAVFPEWQLAGQNAGESEMPAGLREGIS